MQHETLAWAGGPDAGAAPRTLDTDEAFDRYEAIRSRLPRASVDIRSQKAPSLLAIADRYDGFLFDSFGVLNVGETAIPRAAECLEALRRVGKGICVLTNAASYTSAEAHRKYLRLGLDIRLDEIVSSRDVAFAHLETRWGSLHWAAIAAEGDGFADTEANMADLMSDDGLWDAAEGFMFLSSARWTPALQERLVDSLRSRPRPVVVGNPDLVAPREAGLTIEPGFWAHDLEDRTAVAPAFFGKPYADAFRIAADRLGGGRLAMIGDTLHTDILGGQAAGYDTVLVTDHGLFAGQPVASFISRSQIVPTWIIPSI